MLMRSIFFFWLQFGPAKQTSAPCASAVVALVCWGWGWALALLQINRLRRALLRSRVTTPPCLSYRVAKEEKDSRNIRIGFLKFPFPSPLLLILLFPQGKTSSRRDLSPSMNNHENSSSSSSSFYSLRKTDDTFVRCCFQTTFVVQRNATTLM